MSANNSSVVIIPPPKYGTKRYDVRQISSQALSKITSMGNVYIIGLGEAIGIAATVAIVTLKGKRINIDEMHIARLEIDKIRHIAIGIDLRLARKDEMTLDYQGQSERPYVALSLDMTREDAIGRACGILTTYDKVWIAGLGATMSKVVDVALNLPEISSESIGVDTIRIAEVVDAETKIRTTSLAICISKAAAGKSSVDMEDALKQHKSDIAKALHGGNVLIM